MVPILRPVGCQSNNASAPMPGICPGGEGLDPRRCAEAVAESFSGEGIDPRIPGAIPGFDAPFYQSGLAGYSDAAMRIIARRHGCPACVTEALLDRTLLAGGRGFAKADLGAINQNLPGSAEDFPLIGQIMGSEPAEMAAAALKMIEQGRRRDRAYRDLAYEDERVHAVRTEPVRAGEDPSPRPSPQRGEGGRCAPARHTLCAAQRGEGGGGTPARHTLCAAQRGEGGRGIRAGSASDPGYSFSAIDVNLACPVKKIAKKSRGGHWLAEPAGAIAILEAVRGAVPASVPVTVKMRRSFDDSPEMVRNFWAIFDAAYEMGCAWVTVHGRTVAQKYIGPSRWDLLREICRARPERVVFGSGDIWQAGDIFRMMAYTGVSGVSVARGCIGNPWIFRQARDLMAGREPKSPTIAEQRSVLMEHFELALRWNRTVLRHPESQTGKMMRKFGIRFAQHHPDSELVRQRMIAVGSLDDWRAVLDELYVGGDGDVR